MRIFIICSVRGASEEYKNKLENYVSGLECDGHKVHLPHRDTNQQATGFDICSENRDAIMDANEVHIFYSSSSQGTHFDMGVAFANFKTIRVIESEPLTEGKSYQRMLKEWAEQFV